MNFPSTIRNMIAVNVHHFKTLCKRNMTMKEKKITFSGIILGLLIISILIIGGIALKDVMMTPTERLKVAVHALDAGEYKKAERAFLIVEEKGNAQERLSAAYYLAQMYLKGAKGFAVNAQKAAIFYEKAASAGLAEAQYQLALLYDTGDKIPENRSKALLWMNEAAKQGMPDALYGLGVWIERGYMGNDISMDKVVALYEVAAVQGQKNAMTSLVSIYASGHGRFPNNVEKATYWKARLDELNQQKNNKTDGQ